jgi:hypothetical protein
MVGHRSSVEPTVTEHRADPIRSVASASPSRTRQAVARLRAGSLVRSRAVVSSPSGRLPDPRAYRQYCRSARSRCRRLTACYRSGALGRRTSIEAPGPSPGVSIADGLSLAAIGQRLRSTLPPSPRHSDERRCSFARDAVGERLTRGCSRLASWRAASCISPSAVRRAAGWRLRTRGRLPHDEHRGSRVRCHWFLDQAHAYPSIGIAGCRPVKRALSTKKSSYAGDRDER